MNFEYDQLEKQLSILSKKLQDDLKSFLRERGHEGTGELENSIKVQFKKDVNGYKLEINALKYIIYLEHGQFLEDFKKKNMEQIKKIIGMYAVKDIVEDLKRIKTENIYP